MQDLKHISKKKRLIRLNVLKQQEQPSRKAHQELMETSSDRKRLRLILPVLAVLLALYPVFNLLVSNTDDHLRNHGFILAPARGWPIRVAASVAVNVSYCCFHEVMKSASKMMSASRIWPVMGLTREGPIANPALAVIQRNVL